MHAWDVLRDEWAERAERAVQRDVLLQWGGGDCDTGGRCDGRGLSCGALLSDWECGAVGVRAGDVQLAQWEWECCGLRGVRCWAVLRDVRAEYADCSVL